MVNNQTLEEAFKNTFHTFPRNSSYVLPGFYDLTVSDVAFPVVGCLIIFQMQTGFALVEAGIVRSKNGVNIMMKNIADVCIGGLAFWIFGFGLMFGRGPLTTPFYGSGDFFMDAPFGDPLAHQIFTLFLYQMSYATTSNTIVSGALAERANFGPYCVLTFFMTVLYSLGAGWCWGEHGWLRNLGVVDLSGSVIHIIGGAAGCACAWYIGPRIGRYDNGKKTLPMGSAMNACVGLFILWWGWIAFNMPSYGITNGRWEYSIRGAVGTAFSTWGGGAASIFFSMYRNKGRVDVYEVVSGILSSLVASNGGCFVFSTPVNVLVGAISAIISISAISVFDHFGIDDPIGVFSVHWLGGIWGMFSVGLFAKNPIPLSSTSGREGILMGGDAWLFYIQIVALISLSLLGFFGALPIIYMTDKFFPLRLSPEDEEKGCDVVEHGVIDDDEKKGKLYSDTPPILHSDAHKVTNLRIDDVNVSIPTSMLNFGSYKYFNDSLRNRQLNVESVTNTSKL